MVLCMLQPALVSGLHLATVPRLVIGGLSPSERALVADVVLEATGSEWRVEAVASEHRCVYFEGLDEDSDAWLLQTVAEALDEEEAAALVAAGAVGNSPAEALGAARAAHIENYGLRTPVGTRPTSWEGAQARVVLHAALDGAEVEHEGASWWDVSEAVVLDGVVDEPLRRELLTLLQVRTALLAGPSSSRGARPCCPDTHTAQRAFRAGARTSTSASTMLRPGTPLSSNPVACGVAVQADGAWDPEQGPDPRCWQRGALTDVLHVRDDQDEDLGGTGRRKGSREDQQEQTGTGRGRGGGGGRGGRG